MTQFQLFLLILWTLWFVKPKFRKTSRLFKDIDGLGSCVAAGAIFFAILVFILWFHWTIAGILLPYVNHILPTIEN